jgi:uracil-DNA glycosylase
MQELGNVAVTVLVGGYAQKYHLGTRTSVTDTVAGWRDRAPDVFAVPHPSWRNTAWLRKNPWFEAKVLPELRTQVQRVMDDG